MDRTIDASSNINLIHLNEYISFYEQEAKYIHELCDKYYQGQTTPQEVCSYLQLRQEDLAGLTKVLESFSGLRRKSGGHVVEHTLRLVKLAKHLGVTDDKVFQLALVHDLQEDAGKYEVDIAEMFGKEIGLLSSQMTEQRTNEDRVKDLVRFVKKLKISGPIVAQVELLDRLDDISDIGYLTNKLDGKDSEKYLEEIAKKLAKCRYTIDNIEIPPTAQQSFNIFNQLYQHQISTWNVPLVKIQQYIKTYEDLK
jgi:(p)ppGpp synthase/HD superfamily hydrolase